MRAFVGKVRSLSAQREGLIIRVQHKPLAIVSQPQGAEHLDVLISDFIPLNVFQRTKFEKDICQWEGGREQLCVFRLFLFSELCQIFFTFHYS